MNIQDDLENWALPEGVITAKTQDEFIKELMDAWQSQAESYTWERSTTIQEDLAEIKEAAKTMLAAWAKLK